MKIKDNFCNEWKPSRAYHKIDSFHGEKRQMGHAQRRALVSPWRMYYMYSGMAKDTSRAEAMLNSEKIKPVALAIAKIWESEEISHAVS